MSQLTIQISDKADALIAQLQKEIFNRRRKKVTAEGVVETLLESGAKSQSDKRFATSWQNLIADIEKAAMVAQTHGSKPSTLSDEEWALVLSHRTRSTSAPESKRASKPRAATRTTKAASTAPVRRRGKASAAEIAAAAAEVIDEVASTAPKTRGTRGGAKPARTAKAAATTTAKAKASATPRKRSTTASASATPAKAKAETKAAPKTTTRKTSASTARSSVARRMAKAASRLVSAPIPTTTAAQPAPATPPVNGSNGVDNGLATAAAS